MVSGELDLDEPLDTLIRGTFEYPFLLAVPLQLSSKDVSDGVKDGLDVPLAVIFNVFATRFGCASEESRSVS